MATWVIKWVKHKNLFPCYFHKKSAYLLRTTLNLYKAILTGLNKVIFKNFILVKCNRNTMDYLYTSVYEVNGNNYQNIWTSVLRVMEMNYVFIFIFFVNEVNKLQLLLPLARSARTAAKINEVFVWFTSTRVDRPFDARFPFNLSYIQKHFFV